MSMKKRNQIFTRLDALIMIDAFMQQLENSIAAKEFFYFTAEQSETLLKALIVVFQDVIPRKVQDTVAGPMDRSATCSICHQVLESVNGPHTASDCILYLLGKQDETSNANSRQLANTAIAKLNGLIKKFHEKEQKV